MPPARMRSWLGLAGGRGCPARRLDQQVPALAPVGRLAQIPDELPAAAIGPPERVQGKLLRDQAVADLDLRVLGLIGAEDAIEDHERAAEVLVQIFSIPVATDPACS